MQRVLAGATGASGCNGCYRVLSGASGCTGHGRALAVRPVMGAKRFDELVAWQLGMRLHEWIIEFSRRPNVMEHRRYCDQLVDASSGICRNVAEGFGRWTHRDFHNSLRIAAASHNETESLLNEAVVRGFLTPVERKAIGPLLGRCGKAISALMKNLRDRSQAEGTGARHAEVQRRSAPHKPRGRRTR